MRDGVGSSGRVRRGGAATQWRFSRPGLSVPFADRKIPVRDQMENLKKCQAVHSLVPLSFTARTRQRPVFAPTQVKGR